MSKLSDLLENVEASTIPPEITTPSIRLFGKTFKKYIKLGPDVLVKLSIIVGYPIKPRTKML